MTILMIMIGMAYASIIQPDVESKDGEDYVSQVRQIQHLRLRNIKQLASHFYGPLPVNKSDFGQIVMHIQQTVLDMEETHMAMHNWLDRYQESDSFDLIVMIKSIETDIDQARAIEARIVPLWMDHQSSINGNE